MANVSIFENNLKSSDYALQALFSDSLFGQFKGILPSLLNKTDHGGYFEARREKLGSFLSSLSILHKHGTGIVIFEAAGFGGFSKKLLRILART